MQPSAAPRGCLLLLTQASATMAEPLPRFGGASKLHVACSLFDALIAELAESRLCGAWDVGVVAVGDVATSLVGGTREDDPFVPLSTLAGRLPTIAPPTPAGDAPRALAHAVRLVHDWSRRHDAILRPVVVHCADEAGWSPDHDRLARALASLRGRCAPPVVLTCAFSSARDETSSCPPDASTLGEPWRALWQGSQLLRRPAKGRAFWLNERPTSAIVRLIRVAAKADASPDSVSAPPAAFDSRALWAPKDGHSDDECEDAHELGDGLAVVADGAAQGIFVRAWAQALAHGYRDAAPNPTDADAVAAWLKECRARWKAGIRYNDLHGLAQDKVDRLGANATFVALRLTRDADKRSWHAGAVGDSCLFWLRGDEGHLHASFPLTRSDEFGIAPDLIPSNARLAPHVRLLTAGGAMKEGDWFALATDAVAQYVLRRYEDGQKPDWGRYWAMSQDDWRAEVQALRERREIVNDDSTLVLVRPTH